MLKKKPDKKDDEHAVAKEMQEMKQLLQQVLRTQQDKPLASPATKQTTCPNNFLKNLELLPQVQQKLMDALEIEELQDFKLTKAAKQKLEEQLVKMFVPLTKKRQFSNVMAFVGPTGVGKTTTLAKLAANFALYNDLKIALITIDTFRIGAVAQLKTYGEIIGVDVEAVMTPHELKQAVKKREDCDLVLVDTAGRSIKNLEQINELKMFLNAIRPVDIYLVLNVNTRTRDLLSILNSYKPLEYSKLVFTKIDETDGLGAILNVVHETAMPVAYVTNGQNVPDDIMPGEPERLAKLIMGEVD